MPPCKCVNDPVLLALGLLTLAALVAAALVLPARVAAAARAAVSERLDGVERGVGRLEHALRDEAAESRAESARAGEALREELRAALKDGADATLRALGLFGERLEAMSRAVDARLETFRASVDERLRATGEEHGLRLEGARRDGAEAAAKLRGEVVLSLKTVSDSLTRSVNDVAALVKSQLDASGARLDRLLESNEKRIDALRTTVDARLGKLADDNAARLEKIRQTVDEQLQGTLEKRLGEAFTRVGERLEAVHRGLGEMQALAQGVGDLKKVLTNVKTRGTFGEVQLGALLEQILAPEQYAANVAPKKDSGERVEFAIRMPGRTDGEDEVLLPIDAKFPTEDYQRLVDAAEAGDAPALEAASKALEVRLKACARDIHDKYLAPPRTTDFAILFLPTEGLYAEVLRRPGLFEALARDYSVTLAGPTTLAALLNSLRMGFSTLAIQKRSSEVWSVLRAVKAEFGKFGIVLDQVEKKLTEASNKIGEVRKRGRAIDRKLHEVQALPAASAQQSLLPAPLGLPGEEEELEGERVA
jgi:DNA recombination protein RmuC